MAFPLQYKKLRQAAWQWMEEHEPDSDVVQKGKGELSYKWAKNFFQRHPNLKQKKCKASLFAKGNALLQGNCGQVFP